MMKIAKVFFAFTALLAVGGRAAAENLRGTASAASNTQERDLMSVAIVTASPTTPPNRANPTNMVDGGDLCVRIISSGTVRSTTPPCTLPPANTGTATTWGQSSDSRDSNDRA